ncbi:DNA-binding response regulator, NarL/FixJ family, contains REC and HTH domains [Dyadobacter sp. SG02]|uniref:response regulator transcription factor n=1 Tax=Dyadobacter sp. SG02 TaxID=1855291 RepID=UPI0008B0D292|nr:response regulator transcription factor [Dyadobacter sp. SG02]SEJ37839.1 DNA-binding response regulator, NarL/FixJ family, contains REC and HTH domains [Dyadobacter sp. SG02]
MTILIVTDNHLFSMAIRAVVKKQYPDGIIVETTTVRNAIEVSPVYECQAMILDAGAADAKDTVLLGNFKNANPHTAILVNLGDQTQFMYTFIRAGATALFSNKSLPEEIHEGLRRAENNTRYISSDIQQQLLSHITEKPLNQTLTKREELMADLLVTNKSHQEIAVIAGGSSKSVGYYKRKIFQKLEVDNVVDLAIKLNKVLVNKKPNY